MQEESKVKMIERVTVAKFDKTEHDEPTEPHEVVTQETVTEVSIVDAIMMGWKPKSEVEASATVQIGGSDAASPTVGD